MGDTNSTSFIGRLFATLSKYISKSLIFLFMLVLFITNLIALSLSIKCNKSEGIMFKLASGLYAFMFGILYIFMNYYMYRIKLKQYPCQICGSPFSN
jgi:hypothetical protein